MKTEQITLVTSIIAAHDFSASKNVFVGFGGDLCADGAKALGILIDTTISGEQAPVAVSGIALITSGEAITVGEALSSDANGKAVAVGADVLNGYALDAASAADELIRVLLK